MAMSMKNILKVGAIALAAVALANQFDATKKIVNGDSGWF